MKSTKLILCLAAIIAALFATSCGGSKYADTKQVKSFVLMNSVDRDLCNSYTDEFFTDIDLRKIKLKKLPDDTEIFLSGKGRFDGNPVLEYAHVFIKNSTTSGISSKSSWKLNMYNELYDSYLKDNYLLYDWLQDLSVYSLEDAKKELASVDEKILGQDGFSEYICVHRNALVVNIYRKEHSSEHKIAIEEILKKYVDYIGKKADKMVKMQDCEVDKASTTRNWNSYFVTYEIGDGFYVLVRLTEEKKTDKFEIETLYRGKSMIDLNKIRENSKF